MGSTSQTEEAEAPTGFRAIIRDRSVLTVIALSFVVMIGVGLALPILPLYARSFGVSYAAAGLLTSAFGLARLGGDLLAGPIVDRRGERATASGGLLLVSLSAFVTAWAPNFTVAVTAWAVGGIGSAVFFAAQYSYLLKVVPKDAMARTLGVFYGSFNAGIIAGGFAGGLLADAFGLASPLYIYAVVMALASLLYGRYIRDPGRAGPVTGGEGEGESMASPRALAVVRTLLRRKGFRTVLVVNFAYLWMVTSVIDTLVPLFGKERLGMSTSAIGVVFAIAILVEFAVLYPAGSAADRFGRRAVLLPALGGLAVTTMIVGRAGSPTTLIVTMCALAIASGFAGVPPAAMLADVVPEEHSGTGVGAFRFAGDLAFFLGPLTAGWAIGHFDFSGAFLVASLPIALACAAVFRTQETMTSKKVTRKTVAPKKVADGSPGGGD